MNYVNFHHEQNVNILSFCSHSLILATKAVNFPHLRIINLGDNSIESVEGIFELEAPSLTHMYICNSDLTKG